jgi:hypothetical protein
MVRERALKVVLVVVGLLFIATIYPLIQLRQEPTLQMMLSLYVTLGVFLLLASRNPSAHRSLIAFAVWSSFAHAGTMALQAYFATSDRTHLLYGVLLFATIGAVLLALTPGKMRAAAIAPAS